MVDGKNAIMLSYADWFRVDFRYAGGENTHNWGLSVEDMNDRNSQPASCESNKLPSSDPPDKLFWHSFRRIIWKCIYVYSIYIIWHVYKI